MLYVVYLLYAIASIVAIIGALQIYIQMNTGEGDVTKSIMMLVGACLFMIGATIIFLTCLVIYFLLLYNIIAKECRENDSCSNHKQASSNQHHY